MAFLLPPETPIEKSRNVRQVSHCEWALAHRARTTSHRLHEQARQLRRESQALIEHHQSQVVTLAEEGIGVRQR